MCPAHAGEPHLYAVEVRDGPLLACLEHLSQRTGVRIVDASGRVAGSRCAATHAELTQEAALRRWLAPLSLAWRKLEDGTVEIVDATRPQLELNALTIEDSASPEVARVLEPGAVLAPTVLAEDATAVTRIEGDWLQRAPWLGFSQIGRYAPNMYGTGQGLAIRGMERGTDDHFTTLTVSLDGIDLGTRLLDDDKVLLRDLQRIDLVRGARSFEAGSAAVAGSVRLISAPPAAKEEFGIGFGWGSAGARQGDVRWSGPLPVDGLSATSTLAYRSVPAAVRFQLVPQENGRKRDTTNARLHLDYSPDAVPGLRAGISALTVSADAADRVVTPESGPWADEIPPEVFDRASFASLVRLTHTRAEGVAGFMRYEDESAVYELHGGDTRIREDGQHAPHEDWTDATREERSRGGFSVRRQWGDTTAVVGVEHTRFLGYAESELPTAGGIAQSSDRLSIASDSALLWLEHRWAPAWEAGLGLRWLREGFAEDIRTSLPWHNSVDQIMILPLATLAWRPSDAHSVILSRTAGYTSGGTILTGTINDANAYRHYPASPTRSVELAWHAAWTPAVRTDVTMFRGATTDRRNLLLAEDGQEKVRVVITDAKGAEVETTLTFSPRWQWRVGLGLLDSHYRDDATGLPEGMQAIGHTPSAPRFTALLGLRYGAPNGWYAALDAYRAGATTVFESSATRRMAYTVVDGSVGYVAPGWQVSLATTNLTDARYVERFSSPSYLTRGWRLGDPRRVELRLDFSW